ASAPDLWDNPESAQAKLQELSDLRSELDLWDDLSRRVADALALLELAAEDGDEALIAEVAEESNALEKELDRLEFRLLLSGPYDRADAILAIHAGAGGTDAQDWTEMLLRMYLRWAESQGYKTEILDSLTGEEAGLKRAMVSIAGRWAYGYLSAEKGVHRLVRLSPFDAARRRHTSFALIEVWPDIADDIKIKIDPNDLQIDTFRASGAGGQHVQKNETAVRITHLPTGIVVSCQNERSLNQNREVALKILRARLYEIEERKRQKELAELKGDHIDAGWGNQIRSYVLHPYQMVKDHRTNHESGNPAAVLDGSLGDFI
ncbi:MAG: peptide chain release factor 2, partial [Burkholderiales bacterium]|nr:peptide chain release factor 2 [Burkholderiales bacterium]